MKALILTQGGFIAAKVLRAWLLAGNSVAAIWIGSANLDRFARRNRPLLGLAPREWSITKLARQYHIPVQRNPRLSTWTDVDFALQRLNADVLITAMTLQIVPANVLSWFSDRAVNIHPAVLPYYRGPSPRVGLVLDGKAHLYGGVTLHCLSREIDKGDIIGIRKVPHKADRSFIYWEVCLARAAGELVQAELQDYLNGSLRGRPQSPKAGSYRKVRRNELTLSDEHSASHTKWLCNQLGISGRLRFRSEETSYRVTHFVRQVGPRTNKAASIGKFTIEFDAADARVRVLRQGLWTRLLRFVEYWFAIAQTRRNAW